MKKPVIYVYESPDQLVTAFTSFFIDQVRAVQAGEPFRVALSGGNTPKIWFEYMVSLRLKEVNWSDVHFYWGDERCVPPEDADSNYGMAKRYLLDHLIIPDENIHRILGEIEPYEAAERYGSEIQQFGNAEAKPVFDLVILGLGEDGHTASIFPHEIHLWEASKNCVVATHPDTGQKRVSMTGRVINSAKAIAFLVSGGAKAEKVNSILRQDERSKHLPAALVRPESGSLYWFLDKAASRRKNHDQ